VGADARDRAGQPGDGVVVVDHRAVAGPAARRQAHPGHALLRGLDQVDAATAHGGGEPADLAHGLGAVGEQVGVLLDEDPGAVVPARLLVGGEAQHQLATGCGLRCRAGAHDAQQHRVEVLHVDRAAPPDVTVLDLAAERVDLPVGRLGRYDVEVAVDQQRGATVAAAPARHHVGPARAALDDPALDPDLVEQRGDVLGGLALPRPVVRAVVGRVDGDQVLAELDDLTGGVVRAVCRAVRGHLFHAVHPAPRASRSPDSSAANCLATLLQHSSGWRNWQTR
jgi:hypothetical protein